MESIRARERPNEVSVNQASHKYNSKSPFVSYLRQLAELARGRDKLEKGTIHRMTQSKILLGYRRVKRGSGNASIAGDEDDWHLQDELLQPSEVVVVDDTDAYKLFGDRIYCAPQFQTIEGTQSHVFGLSCMAYCNQNCIPSWALQS